MIISAKQVILILVAAAAVAVGVFFVIRFLQSGPEIWDSELRIEEVESFGRNLVDEIGPCERYSQAMRDNLLSGIAIPGNAYEEQQRCYFTIADQCHSKYGSDNPLRRACDYFGQIELSRQINVE